MKRFHNNFYEPNHTEKNDHENWNLNFQSVNFCKAVVEALNNS